MGIHHATIAKAEKNGVILRENEDDISVIEAHIPEVNRTISGKVVKTVLAAAMLERRFAKEYPLLRCVPDDTKVVIAVMKGDDAHDIGLEFENDDDQDAMFADVLEYCSENGIDVEGDADEQEDEVTGSVVKDRYKKLYAERGDATNCGDWLAVTLKHWCHVAADKETGRKAGFDIDRFELILTANGVDISNSKAFQNRTRGWQGRARMTGRRLLLTACKDAEALVIPAELTGEGDVNVIPEGGWPKN